MRVLVTGSSGFIGSHVVEQLLDAGHSVRAVDRREVREHSPVVESTTADISDDDVLNSVLPGVDVVCHQAAKVGLGVDVADLPAYAADNDLATAKLMAAMSRHSIDRLVLASSMVVYGEGRYECDEHGTVTAPPRELNELRQGRFEPLCDRCQAPLRPELVSEEARIDPRNVYAATKVAQEHLAAAWARQSGAQVIALRYHNVYGPRMPRNTPYAGVASIFRSAIARGESPKVFEDGKQRRDFVHVRDVAAANLAAVQAIHRSGVPEGELRPYNVGSGHVHTVHDLAKVLSSTLQGHPPTVTGDFRTGDVRHITASSARIRTELGWRAEIGFEDGVAELATAE